MTTPTSAPLEPLWSDEDIATHARRNADAYTTIYEAMRFSMQMVRNDYEGVRAAHRSRIELLEADRARLTTALAEAQGRVASVEVLEAISSLRAFVVVHLFMYHPLGAPDDDPYQAYIRTVQTWLDSIGYESDEQEQAQ